MCFPSGKNDNQVPCAPGHPVHFIVFCEAIHIEQQRKQSQTQSLTVNGP